MSGWSAVTFTALTDTTTPGGSAKNSFRTVTADGGTAEMSEAPGGATTVMMSVARGGGSMKTMRGAIEGDRSIVEMSGAQGGMTMPKKTGIHDEGKTTSETSEIPGDKTTVETSEAQDGDRILAGTSIIRGGMSMMRVTNARIEDTTERSGNRDMKMTEMKGTQEHKSMMGTNVAQDGNRTITEKITAHINIRMTATDGGVHDEEESTAMVTVPHVDRTREKMVDLSD